MSEGPCILLGEREENDPNLPKMRAMRKENAARCYLCGDLTLAEYLAILATDGWLPYPEEVTRPRAN